MAIFRKIHTSFWSDSFISELDTEQKLFYIYLMTNDRTKQCGVYEITKKQISFDLGYSIDRVSKLLQYFIKTGKIRYNEDTKELAIGNWLKYNNSTSPKVQQCINQEFNKVKDTVLIEYVKSMDTASQEEQEEEEEEEEEEKKEQEEKFSFKNSLISEGADKKLLDDWMIVRKTKKAANTETALKSFLNEVNKSGRGLNEILFICAERSWQGFKAEWLNNSPVQSTLKFKCQDQNADGFFYPHYTQAEFDEKKKSRPYLKKL